MNAFHFQEGFINERLQGVFSLAALFFHLSLSVWFSGGCSLQVSTEGPSWVKGSCQSLLKTTSFSLGHSNLMCFGSVQAKS